MSDSNQWNKLDKTIKEIVNEPSFQQWVNDATKRHLERDLNQQPPTPAIVLELFKLRRLLYGIDGLLDKLAFYNSNHDAIGDLQILRDSINIPNTWQGDAGTWNPPTVSESERAE